MQEYALVKEESAKTVAAAKARVHYTNHTKVLLCYALAWGLALALPIAALCWVYPYRLAHTAPALAENLRVALPFLGPLLDAPIKAAAIQEGMSAGALAQALAARDAQWQACVAGLFALAWIGSMVIQLAWRGAYIHPLGISRVARRAIGTYRLTFLGIVLLNGLGALILFLLGIRFIGGKTAWDWILYVSGFGLNILAAWVCFRLGAPPAISGKHSFFKRL